MTYRSSFRHMPSLLGLGLLLILGSSVGQAQSLCSQILLSAEKLSLKQAEGEILALAKMKLALDTSIVSSGRNQSPEQKMFAQEFGPKFQEILGRANISEVQLRNEIASKIAEIQNAQRNQEKKQKVRRTQEQQMVKPIEYVLRTRQVSQNAWPLTIKPTGELTRDGRFIYEDNNTLYIYDPRADLSTQLFESRIRAAKNLPDGEHIAILDMENNFLILKIATQEVTHKVPLKIKKVPNPKNFEPFGSLDLSPDGSTLLLAGLKILVFNTQTGKRIAQTDNKNKLGTYISNAFFINDHEIVFQGTNTIFKYDILTKTRTHQRVESALGATYVGISDKGRSLSILQPDHRRTLSLKDLTIEEQLDIESTVYHFKMVPTDHFHAFIKDEKAKTAGIYDVRTWNKVFDFEHEYDTDISNRTLVNILFSRDKQTALVLSAHKKDQGWRVDTWELR